MFVCVISSEIFCLWQLSSKDGLGPCICPVASG